MGVKLFIFGLFVTAFSLAVIILNKKIVQTLVKMKTKLTIDTIVYKNWLDPPVPIYMNLYLFNLINPKEFINNEKPIFAEVGPFVYKEIRTKENIVNNNNYTITYNERRQFYFVRELSAHDENYNITTINMALLTIINFMRYKPEFMHSAVNLALTLAGENLIITQPAGKLLFGYNDTFLTVLNKFLPNLAPTPYLSFFYNKNNTFDGQYTIFTGEDDVNKIGKIERFYGMDSMPNWSNRYANQINGTDSSVIYPFLEKTSKPYTFQSDVCRSLYEVYNESKITFNDIELYGYILDENIFANVSINPDNEGFCIPAGNCLPSGVLNQFIKLEDGEFQTPTYFSLPHFLFGDEQLRKDVAGLNPNFEKHRTIAYFEPITGTLMQANKRIQISTKLIRDKRIDVAKNVSEIYFPLFWLDENAIIDQKTADIFFKEVKLPILILNIVQYVLLSLGLLLVNIITFKYFYYKFKKQNDYDIIETPDINGDIKENTPLIID